MRSIKLKNRGAKCHWCDQIATKKAYGFGKKACPTHTNLLRLEEESESRCNGEDSEGTRQAMRMFKL